jgi:dinuclear metal center YbgI/SA1388 family protein
MPAPTFRQLTGVVETIYPSDAAESWDAVGPVCGDLDAPVARVLMCVDPHPLVVQQAIDLRVDVIIAHHPLLLTPVHGVATNTPAGQVIQQLVSHGIGLLTAHTNADVAIDGVSDALSAALGVVDAQPLTESGLGRIGLLRSATTLAAFADEVARSLPSTAHGVRVAGDPRRVITRVAVCGGSGDSLLPEAAKRGADVFVTSDLKHHRLLDHQLVSDCAVVDVAHWAGEWPWLAWAAGRLSAALADQGATVEFVVSNLVTDPWTFHVPCLEATTETAEEAL